MRTGRIVLPILVVVAAGLFLQGSRASAQQSTPVVQAPVAQAQASTPQVAPLVKTPLLQALEAASKAPVTKRRSGVSFPKNRNGRQTSAEASCAIYCGGELTSVTPAVDIFDCACQCVSTCGGDSCTDLDTGDIYFC